MKLGAHVSVAGGLANGPAEGKAIGAEVIQIFTRNQRQWGAKPVTLEEAGAFRQAIAANGIACTMSHASYLLNLGAPSAEARRRSERTFREELVRCTQLGVQLLNFHPGAHLGAGEAAALAHIAAVVRVAIQEAEDDRETRAAGGAARARGARPVTLVIENTAGQGTCVGHRFEHLRDLLEAIGPAVDRGRVGICLDTQHCFAAGYDVKSEAGFEAMLAEFDRVVGLRHLCAFHLNDSKVELGGRVDRHQNLGKGAIGPGLFERLVRDPRFRDIPAFLETPGGAPAYRDELAWLRQAEQGAPRREEPRPRPPPRARPKRS